MKKCTQEIPVAIHDREIVFYISQSEQSENVAQHSATKNTLKAELGHCY